MIDARAAALASGRRESGIRVAASQNPDCRTAVAELKAELLGAAHEGGSSGHTSAGHTFSDLGASGQGGAGASAAIAHALVFFSPKHEAGPLAQHLQQAFPGVAISGCMTAGEITPGGLVDGAIVMIAFPADKFRIHAALIPDIHTIRVELVGDYVRGLKTKLSRPTVSGEGETGRRAFAMVMIDGLSNVEEMLVAAIHCAIDDIPLVGGSAGDGLAFERSLLIHDGKAWDRSALLLMFETDVPFEAFKTSNFEPTPTKLVVTAADTANRIVYELNAEPAAREYASAIGLLTGDLGPFSFASYPLVVKVGGDYYCRSIRNMNSDGSLTFFCAIDEGLVFTVARPQDLVSSAERTLKGVEERLGGIDMVLGFDCILRRLDAENRQVRSHVSQLYQQYGVVGFHTYGEQYNAMHLNQTLTGIAFGRKGIST